MGRWLPSTLTLWQAKPAGVQFAEVICPPRRQTRTSSAAASSGRGAHTDPNMLATMSKNEIATGAYAERGIVQEAIRAVRRAAPEMVVIADACLCEYAS